MGQERILTGLPATTISFCCLSKFLFSVLRAIFPEFLTEITVKVVKARYMFHLAREMAVGFPCELKITIQNALDGKEGYLSD